MKISIYNYQLKFKHTFHIAAGARDTTDAVFVKLEQDGVTGYGEVALPPYLIHTTESVTQFLNDINLPENYHTDDFFPLLKKWNAADGICYPALAALDIALHDLQGKLTGKTIREIYQVKNTVLPLCAFTIGMSAADEMEVKLKEANQFQFFKLKLGGDADEIILKTFRQLSPFPFCVDANRGWKDVENAAEFCFTLKQNGCEFIEQPFEKDKLNETDLLRKCVQLPIILDESIQTFSDVEKVKNYCDGINIKLAKCGGLYPAFNMIEKARSNNLKIFIGCMSEGSCGCGAAAQLAPLADWVDLDGPLLISNDPFSALSYSDGRIQLNNLPGTGMVVKNNLIG
ncbi:MAG: dipeptide epimerase [Bacteroidota bacterium]